MLDHSDNQHCETCSVRLHAGARFCHNCGRPTNTELGSFESSDSSGGNYEDLHRLGPRQYLEQVAENGHRLASERRFVTTLFCDVVGSTSMAEKLDPEEITAVMNDAFTEMMEPVNRYEGTLARLMGDGVLCLFGAPVSHEDDALRACRSAMEIMAGIADLSERICARHKLASFEVRIGISTGLAVVGEVGTNLRSEYTAMGDSVNLAARLQHAAEPSEILVCHETWQLVKHEFVSRNSNTLNVRGRSKPIQVYSLDYSRKAGGQLKSGRQYPTTVGREKELRSVEEAFQRFDSGHDEIIALYGRAGIGKTHLLKEAQKLKPADAQWIEATCMAYMQTMSYWVAREFVCRLIDLDGNNYDDIMLELRNIVSHEFAQREVELSLSENAPLRDPALSMSATLGKLLQAEVNEREASFIDGMSAEALNQRIIAEAIKFVLLRAGSRKLVIVFEDIHWIDPESLLLIKALMRRMHEGNILLVLVSRDDYRLPLDEILDSVSNDPPKITELHLGAMNESECRQFTRVHFQDVTVPEQTMERIIEIADGNAFFLLEILRSVGDSANSADSGTEGSRSARIPDIVVPKTVQAAILARVDLLSAATRAILKTASVLGRAFRLDLLVTLLKPSFPVSQICQALSELIRKEYVSVGNCCKTSGHSRGRCVDDDSSASLRHLKECCDPGSKCEFYFVHALLQEVVYETLLYSMRRELHARAALALEKIHGTDIEKHAALIAFHFDRGAQAERAIHYYSAAGRQAADVFSLESALSSYTRASELVTEVTMDNDPALVATLYEGLGDVHFTRSEYETALHYYDKSLRLFNSRARAVNLQLKRGRLLQKWGRYTDAKTALETALEELEENFDQRLAGRIYTEFSLTHYRLNELELAEELGNLALYLERESDDLVGIARACNNLGVILTRKRDWEKAGNRFEECAQLAAETGDSYGLAACYNNWGRLAVEQRDWDAAVDRFNRSREFFEMLDNRHGLARVYDNLSQVSLCRGDDNKAEKYLAKAVTILAEIGAKDHDFQPEMWQSGAW